MFPFIAAVFTLPYAVYQYNKHGSVSKYRTLIIQFYPLYVDRVLYGQPAAAGQGIDSREYVAGSP